MATGFAQPAVWAASFKHYQQRPQLRVMPVGFLDAMAVGMTPVDVAQPQHFVILATQETVATQQAISAP